MMLVANFLERNFAVRINRLQKRGLRLCSLHLRYLGMLALGECLRYSSNIAGRAYIVLAA
jgi:hypothetical protein